MKIRKRKLLESLYYDIIQSKLLMGIRIFLINFESRKGYKTAGENLKFLVESNIELSNFVLCDVKSEKKFKAFIVVSSLIGMDENLEFKLKNTSIMYFSLDKFSDFIFRIKKNLFDYNYTCYAKHMK